MQSEATARILVVDDEPAITDSVAMAFRYDGYDVAIALGGDEALALVAQQTFDLLVLDVMLPDVGGLEVTRRIRANGSDVPVLFLTAKSTVTDRVTGLSIG